MFQTSVQDSCCRLRRQKDSKGLHSPKRSAHRAAKSEAAAATTTQSLGRESNVIISAHEVLNFDELQKKNDEREEVASWIRVRLAFVVFCFVTYFGLDLDESLSFV